MQDAPHHTNDNFTNITEPSHKWKSGAQGVKGAATPVAPLGTRTPDWPAQQAIQPQAPSTKPHEHPSH